VFLDFRLTGIELLRFTVLMMGKFDVIKKSRRESSCIE